MPCLAVMKKSLWYMPCLSLILIYLISFAMKQPPCRRSLPSTMKLSSGQSGLNGPSWTTWWSAANACSCLLQLKPGGRCSNMAMAWAMRASRRRYTSSVPPSRRATTSWCEISSKVALFANNKTEHLHPAELLQPLTVPSTV
jgi:hypothetical protein